MSFDGRYPYLMSHHDNRIAPWLIEKTYGLYKQAILPTALPRVLALSPGHMMKKRALHGFGILLLILASPMSPTR